MKPFVLFCIILFTSMVTLAQDSLHLKYWERYKSETKIKDNERGKDKTPEYQECVGNNYLSTAGFNAISKQLFAKVIVGMDGLPKEGTASSLSIDDETSKLGGNVNFSLPKAPDMLFNIGVGGTASSNQVTLFTENAYQKGFKLHAGVNLKTGSSIIYEPDSCGKVIAARNAKFASLIKKIHAYEAVRSIDLQERIRKTRGLVSPQKHPDFSTVAANNIDSIQTQLAKQMDSLFFIATYIRNIPKPPIQVQRDYMDSIPPDHPLKKQEQVDSTIRAEIGQFELKNALTIGYSMRWLSVNYSFGNNAYNIFDTSVTRIFSEATKKQFYRSHNITLSYNYGLVTPKIMLFLFGGIAAGNRYALEDLKLEDDTLVGKVGIYLPELSVKAIDVSKFAEVYNKSYNYIMLQAGGFAFFGEKKIMGVEAYAGVRIKHKVPELIDPKPAYSIRFGPLFSMTKEKGVVSNGTLGLLLQSSEFTPSRKNFGDRFSFAVRLSIPFSNLKYL